MSERKINSILISVFDKEGLDTILERLNEQQIKIYSTGGTYEFIRQKGFNAIEVESVTGYPSIFGGRVKTLHPAIFGGILSRRDNAQDKDELEKYGIPMIDCVVVDLYPFEKTVAAHNSLSVGEGRGEVDETIIEKIDIGGISLIRGAAKNFNDVVIIPSKAHYKALENILANQNGSSNLEQRKHLAAEAFGVTSHYDTAIHNWFNPGTILRYGENPHQQGFFKGDLTELFEQLNGKEISYNNLLDMDAAMGLIVEFSKPTVAILKHNNACGCASAENICEAWKRALAGDPVAAFGGVVICNGHIDLKTAEEIHKVFIEVLIAPSYDDDALALLKEKKNRIILKQKKLYVPQNKTTRTALNGSLIQDYNNKVITEADFNYCTNSKPTEGETRDLLFANIINKHLKSNAITLVKNEQLIGSGCGQTSRIDALKGAIEKAKNFGFDLKGAVMASDAFFPFPDCVQVAHEAGISAVIQPGGSVKDKESVGYCNANNLAMVMTGVRHFKH
jgi:phosphoribosylaminoimidazolecarboxamide formyltransferase/IMP cyclohydrolase